MNNYFVITATASAFPAHKKSQNFNHYWSPEALSFWPGLSPILYLVVGCLFQGKGPVPLLSSSVSRAVLFSRRHYSNKMLASANWLDSAQRLMSCTSFGWNELVATVSWHLLLHIYSRSRVEHNTAKKATLASAACLLAPTCCLPHFSTPLLPPPGNSFLTSSNV